MFAHDMLLAGTHEVMVAGGMESMTNAPYLMLKGRGGYRMGHDRIYRPHDARRPGGRLRARPLDGHLRRGLRGQVQVHARSSRTPSRSPASKRAKAATESGAFTAEITPVTVKGRAGETVIAIDEGPGKVKLDKIPTLKPAFKKDGTITAASSSSINDGAAALVMMTESHREALRRASRSPASSATPRTRRSPSGSPPRPVGAVAQAAGQKTGWKVEDVDLWEVNEAFAVVPMALMTELKVSHDIVNVNGGACALGHPIGASGARIMVTLIHALKARGGKRGVATLCIGGGEGTAVAIELI